MGKTALATNIAYHVAKTYRPGGDAENALDGAVVGFFSLEMSAEQLATRIISEQAYIPSERIRRGRIDADEFDRIVEVSQELQHLPLYIDQTGGITVAQLAARARRLKRQRGLGFIVVDYLQLLSGSSKRAAEGRVQEVSEITTGLKALAKELHVPVLALSQLSRQVEQREDKRPQLADLRESGSIEQDADVVLFVFREEYYLERSQPRENTEEHKKWQAEMEMVTGKADVIIGKQRHGPTGTVTLQFTPEFTQVQQSRRGGAPAGAAGVKLERPPEAASSERDDGASDTAILTIDLDALAANYRRLRDLASPAECAAVVKADAYGLGMAQAAPALARAGCKTFFVATLGEARALARASPRRRHLCVCRADAGHGRALPRLRSSPRAEQRRGDQASGRPSAPARGEKLACAVHIDSGMNRLGLSAEEVDRVAERARALASHDALPGDEPSRLRRRAATSEERSAAQIFRPAARANCRRALASLANSAGILLGRAYAYDLVRPGIALYGGKPRARGRQSVPARGASQGPHPASAQGRRRRDRRLRRHPHAEARPRASPSSRWAMPTASSASLSHQGRTRRASSSISARMPRRSSAASRWI